MFINVEVILLVGNGYMYLHQKRVDTMILHLLRLFLKAVTILLMLILLS